MTQTRSGNSYNFMDRTCDVPNPSDPNNNPHHSNTNLQQQLDQMTQMLEAVVRRLDVLEERHNREQLRRPTEGRGALRRENEEAYSDLEGEDEVLMGGEGERGRGRQVIHERGTFQQQQYQRQQDVRREPLDELTK